ncbi:MAG TPA: DUF2007 domain-containing protein [Bryobacteraceae bacterium]|nr:DUF2007 domain-containing protein [Bryobacteraceae bacterium]
MDVNLEDFRRHFELLSDDALLATNRDDLVETARGCYDEEVTHRGLNAPAVEEAVEEEAVTHQTAPGAELVLIATYSVYEEANLARGLLESAEIPYQLQNEYLSLGGIELRLVVPAAYEEEALQILDSEISEEELAAQAEAAGVPEDDEENSDE